MSERIVTIPVESRPGYTAVRIASLDERIIIDSYDPSHPEVLWYCDHCQSGYPVTAQFTRGTQYITLCATCLQNALNGIAYSLANPKALDGAA